MNSEKALVCFRRDRRGHAHAALSAALGEAQARAKTLARYQEVRKAG